MSVAEAPVETVDERYARARERYCEALGEFCHASDKVAEARVAYDREWARRRKAATQDVPVPEDMDDPEVRAVYGEAVAERLRALADEFPEYLPPGTFSYAELDRKLRAQTLARW